MSDDNQQAIEIVSKLRLGDQFILAETIVGRMRKNVAMLREAAVVFRVGSMTKWVSTELLDAIDGQLEESAKFIADVKQVHNQEGAA